MKKLHIFLAIAMGLGTMLALAWLTGKANAHLIATAGITASEANLNQSILAGAYEINQGSDGHLWISDFGAGEIWQVHPPSGSYTIYQVGGAPNDARLDASGDLWWADSESLSLAMLPAGTKKASFWDLPDAVVLLGTGVDGAGRVWVTDSSVPYLYRFDPSTSQLCKYSLPDDSGKSDYMAIQGNAVWLGDSSFNNRILRLETNGDLFTYWELESNGDYVEGLAFDDAGDLWWADRDLGHLARLEPAQNRLTTFALPANSTPEMVATAGDKVWYSADGSGGTIGFLDPDVASGTSHTLSSQESQTTPACSQVQPSSNPVINSTGGTLSWSNVPYPAGTAPPGVTTYQMPSGASPWGITVYDEKTWAVDNGRQVLVRLPPVKEYFVYLPMVRR